MMPIEELHGILLQTRQYGEYLLGTPTGSPKKLHYTWGSLVDAQEIGLGLYCRYGTS
jgi:hypothetical protein